MAGWHWEVDCSWVIYWSLRCKLASVCHAQSKVTLKSRFTAATIIHLILPRWRCTYTCMHGGLHGVFFLGGFSWVVCHLLCQTWPEGACSQLQNSFEHTDWRIFESPYLEEYTTSILTYIEYCTDTATIEKRIRVCQSKTLDDKRSQDPVEGRKTSLSGLVTWNCTVQPWQI